MLVAHTCNPRTREAETGGSGIPGQPRLQGQTLSQKKPPIKQKLIDGYSSVVEHWPTTQPHSPDWLSPTWQKKKIKVIELYTKNGDFYYSDAPYNILVNDGPQI
jgi:hypothetical protein